MNRDRWDEVQKLIRDRFSVLDEYDIELDPGKAHCIEFTFNDMTLRACYEVRPVVIDKKTSFTHRAGGQTLVSYTYDEKETSAKLVIERWHEQTQEWQQMNDAAVLTS